MSDFGIAVIEIGARDELDDEWLNEMAPAPAKVHEAQPTASIVLVVSGYDDDPRSLWEIPEAADYVRRFAAAAGLDDWCSDVFKALTQETLAMLLKCDAVQKPHPFTVVIV